MMVKIEPMKNRLESLNIKGANARSSFLKKGCKDKEMKVRSDHRNGIPLKP